MNQNWMATIMTMPRQVDRRKCSNFILHISYCTVCSMKFEHPPVQYEIWTPSFCAVWNLNTLLLWSMKFEHPPSVQYEIWTPVNLAWHDPKLQHGSSDIVRIEEPFRLNVVCPRESLLQALYLSNTSFREVLWSQKIFCQLSLSLVSQFLPKRLGPSQDW